MTDYTHKHTHTHAKLTSEQSSLLLFLHFPQNIKNTFLSSLPNFAFSGGSALPGVSGLKRFLQRRKSPGSPDMLSVWCGNRRGLPFFILASAVQRWGRNRNRRRLSDCQVALTWTWQFSGFVCDGGECDCALLMRRRLRKQNVGIINRQERILSVTVVFSRRMIEEKTPVAPSWSKFPVLSSALYLFYLFTGKQDNYIQLLSVCKAKLSFSTFHSSFVV